MQALTPAAEFAYSPRVRELFADLRHAGTLSVVGATHASPSASEAPEGGACIAPTIMIAEAGSLEQGATVQLQIAVRDGCLHAVRYQAYGCPHFLAACESLAQWLEGRAIDTLSQWRWRDVETELQVPTAKRARLLLLEDTLRELRGRLSGSPDISVSD